MWSQHSHWPIMTLSLLAATPAWSLGPLNDTGIRTCSDAFENHLPCPVEGFPGQDAEFGRDVLKDDDSDGQAGFSFTKLDTEGNALPASATSWSCVRDEVTGLTWEIKTDDGGLRDMDNTYTWYNADRQVNGGEPGTENGGDCAGSACDTAAFVETVNRQGLCGFSAWRLPTRRELLSIVHNDRLCPAIDTDYFSNTPTDAIFWSSSPDASDLYSAWKLLVCYGVLYSENKSQFAHVRLVHDTQ